MQVIVLAPHSQKSGKLVVVEHVLVGRRKAILQKLQIKDHYTRATTIVNDEDRDLRRQTFKQTFEHEADPDHKRSADHTTPRTLCRC
jgi:hypothetical protein